MVVGGVDLHPTLWCIELTAQDVRHQLRDVVVAGLPHRVGEDVHLEIGRFPAEVGHAAFTEAAAQVVQATPVGIGFDRLEVRRRGVVPGGHAVRHLRDLGLRGGEAADGHGLGVEAGVGVGAVQRRSGVAHHGGEDEIGPLVAHIGHDLAEVFLHRVQRHIALGQFFAALALHHELTHDAIRLVGIDVVGADQVDAGAEVRGHELGELHAVLVGRGTGVDHVGRVLEALVQRGVEQQLVPLLDDGDDGLSAARHVAAEDHVDVVFVNQVFGQLRVAGRIGLRVVLHRDQFTAVDATTVVDLVDRQHRPVQLRHADGGGDTGFREQYADPNGVCVSHARPSSRLCEIHAGWP